MITCSCGKTIEKVPSWLQSVKVDFVCNNCPNRQTKNIAFITLQPEGIPKANLEDPEADVADEAEEAEEAEPA